MQSELVQEFVELVRCNDVLQALQYAQKNLAPHAATYMAELQQATAILAFRAETTCQPYARLFEGARWKDLLNLFLQDLFRLHSLPARSLFEVHLQVRKHQDIASSAYGRPSQQDHSSCLFIELVQSCLCACCDSFQ